MSEIDDLNREPRSRHDREFFSYERDSEGKIARRVKIANDSVPVTFDDGGTTVNSYNEILSLAGLASSDIVLYTVPATKKLKLKRIDFSGSNKAVFKIDLNSSIIAKSRTWYTDFNGSIIFEDLELSAGDVIKLVVENKTNSVADFNGNLQGKLLNA